MFHSFHSFNGYIHGIVFLGPSRVINSRESVFSRVKKKKVADNKNFSFQNFSRSNILVYSTRTCRERLEKHSIIVDNFWNKYTRMQFSGKEPEITHTYFLRMNFYPRTHIFIVFIVFTSNSREIVAYISDVFPPRYPGILGILPEKLRSRVKYPKLHIVIF